MSPNERFNKEFGSRLQKLRKERNITARRLGVMIGLNESVAAQHIYRYERGVHSPHLVHFIKLANALGVPAHELVSGDGDYKQKLLYQLGTFLDEPQLKDILKEKEIPLPEPN